MRLAIVVSHPIQYYSPIFRELANRHDIHVYFCQQFTPQQHAQAGFGMEFEWDVDLRSGYASTFLHNMSLNPGTTNFSGCDTPEIGDRLQNGSFDAVLIMGWYLKSYIQALLAARRCRIPVFVRGDSHLDTPRSLLKKVAKELVYPAFLKKFDGALYVGENSQKFYAHYRYPKHRLHFSPHCVDNDWFRGRSNLEVRVQTRKNLNISDDAYVALFAGKLAPFKRPQDVVAAAAQCRRNGRNVHVLIAGSGALEAQICQDAKMLEVPLHMLGFYNQSQMPSAYAASDVLVLPSEGETWGLVANEALACTKPIIVSDSCGCAPDLAADGRAGRVVATGEVQILASTISELMDSPLKENDIRARADQYSVSRAVEGIENALNTVFDKRRW
jgi:glycosyltransferase involved in cell wall biosynthesis